MRIPKYCTVCGRPLIQATKQKDNPYVCRYCELFKIEN